MQRFTDPLWLQREMLALGEAGYKEATLLGQNIDAYGRDLPGAAADGSGRRAWTFTDLLHYVHDVPGIERIRFATSHPRYAVAGAQLGTSVLCMAPGALENADDAASVMPCFCASAQS